MNSQTINAAIQKLITFGSQIGLGLAILFFMVGGVIYLTAGGSVRQMENGKTAMKAAVIGLILVLGASKILNALKGAMGL